MLTQITQLHCAVVPLQHEGSFSKELKMIMDWLSVCRVEDHGDQDQAYALCKLCK